MAQQQHQYVSGVPVRNPGQFSFGSRRNRPDYSDFVVHCCKNCVKPCGNNDLNADRKKIADNITKMKSEERLMGILRTKTIFGCDMPHIGTGEKATQAVCFSECVLASLLDHSTLYGSCGIGFRKDTLYHHGGRPAIYAPQELWLDLMSDRVRWLVTPYRPQCRLTQNHEGVNEREVKLPGKGGTMEMTDCDYSYEREWRVKGDFVFKLDDVQFVIASTIEVAAGVQKEFPELANKILVLDTLKLAEALYPTHTLEAAQDPRGVGSPPRATRTTPPPAYGTAGLQQQPPAANNATAFPGLPPSSGGAK